MLRRQLIESAAFRMDVLDGPALLFLVDNPLFLIIGTGPGLVPLPATAYLPQGAYGEWMRETGITSSPVVWRPA